MPLHIQNATLPIDCTEGRESDVMPMQRPNASQPTVSTVSAVTVLRPSQSSKVPGATVRTMP
eukprot:1850265-Prymnesium_polylepis.1